MSAVAALTARKATGTREARSLADRLRGARTPERMRALLYAVWASTAILCLVGEGALASARRALVIVGKESAPTIVVAQEISAALADIDASAGDLVLGSAAHQVTAAEVFEKRRVEVTRSLVSAAQNVTFAEADRAPVTAILHGFGRYLEIIGEARYIKSTEASQAAMPAGRRDAAIRAYEIASDLMHERLLPAAGALDDANLLRLDRTYRAQRRASGVAVALAIGAGAVLLAILIIGQVFLARRTRRTFNVPLAVATSLAVVLTGYLATRVAAARADLRLATEDAFASIHLLSQARAIAYDANGDETRYLLGGERAASFERAYREKIDKLVSVVRVDQSVPLAKSVTGLLAEVTRNVTFPGEREAVVKMMLAFATYDRIDEQIRMLERTGRHDRAVELCIGAGSDQSNAALERFDRALRVVIDINQAELGTAITRSLEAVEIATVIAPILSVIIALLARRGIQARLAEYAA